MYLMDIYKLLYLTTEKCTCFVNTHGTFTKINYALDHNAGLTQFGAYGLHSLIDHVPRSPLRLASFASWDSSTQVPAPVVGPFPRLSHTSLYGHHLGC